MIPFQPTWRPAVLAGTKTTTVRTKRFGTVGDEFLIESTLFRLVAVDAMTLALARDRCWRSDGFGSAEEFERAWVENHPTRAWRATDSVWVHAFERVR